MKNKKKPSWFFKWIGIFISIVCIVFIIQQVDLREIKSAFLNFIGIYWVIGFFSLTVGYSLRIIRWGVMLRAAGAVVNNINCAAPFLGSMALNNVLPLRAGDWIRAFIFPPSMGVPVTTSTASLFLEKLLDLLTLLLFLATGAYFSAQVALPESIKIGVLMFSIVVFLGFFLMFVFHTRVLFCLQYLIDSAVKHDYKRTEHILNFIIQFFKRLTQMLNRRHFAYIFLLSLGVWLFEAGLFLAILKGLNLSVNPIEAIGIMAITTLATLVPSSPGYVGPFHVTAYAVLAAVGVSISDAANFAILTHLALWLPTTVVGTMAILYKKQLFQGITDRGKMHDQSL